jgi:hypothetical protein
MQTQTRVNMHTLWTAQFKILTAKEYYDLKDKPELAYIDINGNLCEIIEMDENTKGTEQYAAFYDSANQQDWVNATNKDILLEVL